MTVLVDRARRFAGVVAVAALLGCAGAPVVIAQTSADISTPTVEIDDPDDLLLPSAEEMLITETPTIDFPSQVQQVNYIILGDTERYLPTDDSFNDGILEWVGDNRPDLVPDGTGRGASWANGTLIVAVGVETRGNGVYCGDDVCSVLDLFEGGHLDQTLEDMKPGLQRGNYAVGMLDGVRTAADPSRVMEESEGSEDGGLFGWLWGAGAAISGAAGIWAVRAWRKSITATAREQFTRISTDYGDVAQRLDQIDVRAHSLTSPIANDALRLQWTECRDEFLRVNDMVGSTGLTPTSTDRQFRKHHETIAEADTAVTRMNTAEKNIDRIFGMEQGNRTTRKSELTKFIGDINEAEAGTDNPAVTDQLKALEARARELRDSPEALTGPDFMDQFSTLVSEYSRVITLVAKEMEHLDRTKEDRVAPQIWDSDYRVGSGYRGWVPYATVSAWHEEDVAAYESSDSSTDTSFSSGFSGGGGSSRW